MPSATIDTTPYSGSLLGLDLLAGKKTLVLSSFGSSRPGLLVDNDNSFGSADNGQASFDGHPITYIGSGKVTPGVNVLGISVPLGTRGNASGGRPRL